VSLPPGERITVGLVRGLHGLRGAVRVEVLTDEPDRFAVGSVLYADGDGRPLTIVWTGPSKPGLLVRFRELSDRPSVEGLRERYLEAVPTTPLPPETWYWHQILGLEARTADGEVLGSVSDVFRVGEGEVYVVTGGPRGEVLVPAVRSVVSQLRPDAGYLVVDGRALGLGAAEADLGAAGPQAAAVRPDAAASGAGPAEPSTDD
jgi:16S rRNA processing protein RimM